MWPFASSCDEACAASFFMSISMSIPAVLAALPFAAIFTASTLISVRLLFPRLSAAAQDDARDGEDHVLPRDAPAALRQVHAEHGAKSWKRKGGAWAFGATVGLAVTLGALILAEISGLVDPKARNLALVVTVPGLLFMLVVLIPWLECRSLLASAGWSFQRSAKGRVPRFALLLQCGLFGGWLSFFWWLGKLVPQAEILMRHVPDGAPETTLELLVRACLERIGVVGISLMALLSGFASVSSPWHIFGDSGMARKRRPLTEADVNRKQVGLDATCEMLATKRHRLQYLERKIAVDGKGRRSTSGGVGLMGMVMGSFRGQSSEEMEIRALGIEIAGLETMEANLSSNLTLMKSQRAATARASTALGRLLLVPSYIFSAYCVYRILATTLATLRRASSPSASFSSSDPINRFLGLLARHWDPTLDQMAWARIISFALSGVILLASARSAVQTFHLFAKWTPGLLRHAQANLALAVGQVVATYVISASLLLRSQLPSEARTAVGGILRGALTPAFVDRWFEGWFLFGSLLTAVGIWIGRRLGGGGDDDWDDYAMEEMGAKRS